MRIKRDGYNGYINIYSVICICVCLIICCVSKLGGGIWKSCNRCNYVTDRFPPKNLFPKNDLCIPPRIVLKMVIPCWNHARHSLPPENLFPKNNLSTGIRSPPKMVIPWWNHGRHSLDVAGETKMPQMVNVWWRLWNLLKEGPPDKTRELLDPEDWAKDRAEEWEGSSSFTQYHSIERISRHISNGLRIRRGDVSYAMKWLSAKIIQHENPIRDLTSDEYECLAFRRSQGPIPLFDFLSEMVHNQNSNLFPRRHDLFRAEIEFLDNSHDLIMNNRSTRVRQWLASNFCGFHPCPFTIIFSTECFKSWPCSFTAKTLKYDFKRMNAHLASILFNPKKEFRNQCC